MVLPDNHPALVYIRRMKKPCDLYRLFGPDGELLYIGISVNAKRRIYGHKCTAEWAHLICRHTVETFPNREDAIDAEVQAIKREKPMHNIKHATPPQETRP